MGLEFSGRNHDRVTTNDFRLPFPNIPGRVSRVYHKRAFRHHQSIINPTVVRNNLTSFPGEVKRVDGNAVRAQALPGIRKA